MSNFNAEPAFPEWSLDNQGFYKFQQGMTLRDYFAAAALPACINAAMQIAITQGKEIPSLQLAADAYGFADAMLTVRNAK